MENQAWNRREEYLGSCKCQGTREQCCRGTMAGKNELILPHLDEDSVPWGKWPNSAGAHTRAVLETWVGGSEEKTLQGFFEFLTDNRIYKATGELSGKE